MVVEEFHDQKIIYHLNIDEEVNNILMHLSSLKTIKTNRVIKGTTLVGAFYIFSLAFYSYLFHILFAWIFLLLSIGFAAIGLSVEKLQKVFMRAIINKEKQKMNNERKYVFSKEGVDIVTQAGATHNYWSSFVNKGEIENHIYLVRKDNKVILINKNVLSENELLLLRSFIQDIETEQLETENKMSFKMKALVVVTMITIIVSLIYTGIKIGYPLSNGEIFRLWFIRTVPSAGIGMQNNFLSQLADFNYLNIGGMSFWTPHVILISAGIELFVFTFLAIHSYCRHQVA